MLMFLLGTLLCINNHKEMSSYSSIKVVVAPFGPVLNYFCVRHTNLEKICIISVDEKIKKVISPPSVCLCMGLSFFFFFTFT